MQTMDSIMKAAMERAVQQAMQHIDIDFYVSANQTEQQYQQELQPSLSQQLRDQQEQQHQHLHQQHLQQQQQQQEQQQQQQQHYAFRYQQSATPTTHMQQLAYNYQPRHSTTTTTTSSPLSTHSLNSINSNSSGGSNSSSGSSSSNSSSKSNSSADFSLALHSYNPDEQLIAQNQLNLNEFQHYHQMELELHHQMDSPISQNGSSPPCGGAHTPTSIIPAAATSVSAASPTATATATAMALAMAKAAAVAAAQAAASTTPTTAATTAQQQLPLPTIVNHVASDYKTASSSSSCWCYGDSTYHMKILVPAVASGAIIGKGGETIASLQKDTGARVKMSKSHDFYPGTTERVCLITGSTEGIMTVLDFIMDKIREKPDLTTKIIDAESKQTQERDKQVKILVPNSTAGMIIGKGGAFIKQIKEESGSYVQISQKPKDVSLQERCITIIGDKENNKNACKMILSKIVEDPQSGTCLNVSYADVSGPVANFNPTGSPYATNQNAINSSTASLNASLNSTLGTSIGGAGSASSVLVNGTGINLSLNLGAPNPAPNLAVATQLLEHIKVAMRGSGYSESATNEVCAALGVLAKYGVLGIGVGVPHANGAHTTLGNYLGVTTLEQQTAAAATAATAGNVFGAVGQVNLEQYAAAAAAAAAAGRPTQSQLEAAAVQFDPFRHLGTASAAASATTPVSLNNNSFGLTAATGTATTAQLGGLSKSPTPGDLGAKDSKCVEVPEVIIGAVLGPNGRSLVEIQHVSGANVQISKKGIFAPGTRNRIVTITGHPSAIAKAQCLIEQKINEEETKRARQIPLTTVVN
ncbi:RNA-binding protein Pasilla isoform X2 [Drosophila willistoni]|uniref:RNA-binding protein Pasilla isoform X2 n=1 Tax=Drosophila willistoni TaxID=7260 RepID=UPI000C26D56B|nr:RNA-binding protein Pasilla isoform X2 [Drosophila willistoni]